MMLLPLLMSIALPLAADVRVCEEMVSARDGVKLYTRAVMPAAEGKYPCVFGRTPYPDRDELQTPYPAAKAAENHCVKRGYVEVVQHCRGFGRSEGFCRPYVEREDGLDTLAWIRRQPWYNGEIYLVGASYCATVHLCYLADDPPDVKGAALAVQTDRMYYRTYRNGCNYLWNNFSWWMDQIKREYPDQRRDGVLIRPYRDIARRVLGTDDSRYTARLMHVEDDAFWRAEPQEHAVEHIRFPVLWVEGFYDFYIEGMASMWERMLPEWKAKSALCISACGHGVSSPYSTDRRSTGGALAGTDLPSTQAVYAPAALDFFDAIRRGERYAGAPLGKVLYHSIGENRWYTNSWPRKVEMQRLSMPTEERTWTYDPHGPRIPDLDEGKSMRAWEPRSRKDAVEFVSEPYAAEMRYFGRPRVRVAVKSDCEDTQYFFRLDLVTESGTAWHVCQTVTSLRRVARNYRPGDVVTVDLTFPLTGFTVCAGWRVRLDVCSDGGVYVPHANVAKHWALVTEDEVRVAHNAIAAGEVVLELPLADKKK